MPWHGWLTGYSSIASVRYRFLPVQETEQGDNKMIAGSDSMHGTAALYAVAYL